MFSNFRSYMLFSVAFASGVMCHAAHVNKYFFRSVVYLSNSKVALLACGNLLLALILLAGRVLQALCLGPLRLREVERLHVRVREAVIETCLAMTVFREEFNAKFVGMFAVLLFLKIFHWLSKDRVEYMEEQPNSPILQHGRLVTLMCILFFLDIHLLVACMSYTINHGPTMFVLFAFEFAVLLIALLSSVVRYIFLSVDLYFEGAWEAKGMFSFYNELLADMLQLSVYMMFFLYVQAKYQLPFHIIRDIWLTFNKFWKRWSDFKRYRRVMSTMNDFFEDATDEDLAAGDRICIICRDELRTNVKKLACGHMFHKVCLQGWFKRQLNCPTCRATVDITSNRQNGNAAPRAEAQNDFGIRVRRVMRRMFQRPMINPMVPIQNGNGEVPPVRDEEPLIRPEAQEVVQERVVPPREEVPVPAPAPVPEQREPPVDVVEPETASTAAVTVTREAVNPAPPAERRAPQLPLDRLIRIHEQLDMLREEVQELLIDAALAAQPYEEPADAQQVNDSQENTPPAVEAPTEAAGVASTPAVKGGTDAMQRAAPVVDSAVAPDKLDRGEAGPLDARPVGSDESEPAENDSEAIRRKRLEYLQNQANQPVPDTGAE